MKLCEKAPFAKKDKDGKDVKEEKEICLTHHERLDGNSGMVLVSAAIRQVEGGDKEHFMVMVPLGNGDPAGPQGCRLHQGAVGEGCQEREGRRQGP